MECPGNDTVVALLERRLGGEAQNRVGHHIDGCPNCRELMVVLARTVCSDLAPGDGDPPVRRALGSSPPPIAREGSGPIEPGSFLGRYRVERALGRGGMAVVYAAFDPQLDRRVALKLLRPELSALGGEVEARLVRESKAQARLSHPNVVTVHDVGVRDRQVFIAMEYVDGGTLTDWLSQRPRSVSEILSVFTRAGQGLVAAHEAGLVHRDFKPDNVLIGSDGRVCVADFGLARAVGAADRVTPGAPSTVSATTTLTVTGGVVGTPAYMAPEQHEGATTDARTDVFSFCVALYEALYRARPFAGRSAAALWEATISGRIETPPRAPKVPARLRRVVLRGLRAAPEDRYPSMRSLLRALARARRSRLAIVGGAAAALAVVALLFLALGRGAPAAATCGDGGERIHALWNDGVKRQIGDALRAEAPAAAGQWERIERRLDTYTDSWRSMRREACEATERGEQSPELRDRRISCLDGQLDRLGQVVSLLSSGEKGVAAYAFSTMDGVPRLETCARGGPLEARVPPPPAPLKGEVAAIRRELARADVLRLAGKLADSQTMLEPLAKRAAATGYRPIEAEVLYYLGVVESDVDDVHEAHETLRKAVSAAEAGHHDEMAAESWTFLTQLATDSLGDPERAREYADRAKAALERAGSPTDLATRYLLARGHLEMSEQNLAAARETFARAAKLATDDELRLEARARMAMVYENQGAFADAIRIDEQVLAERQRALGPDHPDVALAHANLAADLLQVGRFDDGLVHTARALAIDEAVRGPDNAETARSRYNHAEMLTFAGRFDEALAEHRRALATFEKLHGPDHPDVAASLISQGELLVRMHQPKKAVELTRRALVIDERTYGENHFETARCLINLGDALRLAGEGKESIAIARRGLAAIEKAAGEDSPFVGYGLTGVGRALLDAGQPRAAIEPLERGLALMTRGGSDPGEAAATQLALARALWGARRDRKHALELARAARATFVSLGLPRQNERLEADAWLAGKR